MKIVHIIPSLHKSGGAENLCVNLVASLNKIGQETILITLYNNINFYREELNEKKIIYYCLKKRKGLDIFNAVRLRKLIKKINPDIIHSHLNTEVSFFISRILKNKKIKFFHTIHYSMSKKSKPNFVDYFLIKYYMKNKLINYIAISDEVQRSFMKYMNLNINIPIIYNGLPVKSFQNNQTLDSREKDFICIANFSEIKNHLSLIEAFWQVKQSFFNTTLTLVGDGPMRLEIEKKIKKLKLEKNIFLLGERSDISNLLAKHKYFILPSFREGNPISMLEAMAAGLVILVTKYGGPKDIIINFKNGYLIDPFSIEHIATTMLNCLEHKSINAEIHINNLIKITEYDIFKTAEKHVELYKIK